MKQKSSQLKGNNAHYFELKIQDYLLLNVLMTLKKQALFEMRREIILSKLMHTNTLCPCCRSEDDSLGHVRLCKCFIV